MSEQDQATAVATYQLAYLAAAQIDLCSSCVAHDDHGFVLGPVLEGNHRGRCAAPRHYAEHTREHLDASLEKRMLQLGQKCGLLEEHVDTLAHNVQFAMDQLVDVLEERLPSLTFRETVREAFSRIRARTPSADVAIEDLVSEAMTELIARGQIERGPDGKHRLIKTEGGNTDAH